MFYSILLCYNERCASCSASFLFFERLFLNHNEMFAFVNKLMETTCRWLFNTFVYSFIASLLGRALSLNHRVKLSISFSENWILTFFCCGPGKRCASCSASFLFLERLFLNHSEMFAFVNKLEDATFRLVFNIFVHLLIASLLGRPSLLNHSVKLLISFSENWILAFFCCGSGNAW